MDWTGFLWAVFNIVTLSIPEEAFFVVFSLILLRRFDLLELKSKNIVKISAPIIFPACLTTILRMYAGFDMTFMPFVGIFSVFFLMIIMYKISGFKEILKVFICVTVSSLSIGMIQLSYIPLFMSGTSLTADSLNIPGFVTFIYALPERAIEFLLVAYILLRKKRFLRTNFIKIVTQTKALSLLTVGITVSNLAFVYIMSKAIFFDKLLFNISLIMQALIVVAVLITPLINTFLLLWAVNYITDKEAAMRFQIQEELKVSILDIRFFLKRGEYERIYEELEYLEKDTKSLFIEK